MKLVDALKRAVEDGTSDIFIVAGLPLTFKNDGRQVRLEEEGKLPPSQTDAMIREIYELAGRSAAILAQDQTDDDFSFAINGVGRFRVNVFRQRGSLAAVIRVIQFGIPSPENLGIPDEVMAVTQYHQGIVLVTGHAGSGKSTTLACILDRINHTTCGHILTLEDPVEFVHHHDKCIVSQREIYSDCSSYLSALRSALRESPDVILLGEMRDAETIDVAMTAAETGQLLFSSLHTMGAANTVDRIIDAFPANQQPQVRLQLSMVLQAVITQQLVPGVDGRLIPAFEIMYVNPAIRNLIRESKTHQIDSAIQAGASVGMRTMDASLLQLFREGKITRETVMTHCLNYEATKRKLDAIK